MRTWCIGKHFGKKKKKDKEEGAGSKIMEEKKLSPKVVASTTLL